MFDNLYKTHRPHKDIAKEAVISRNTASNPANEKLSREKKCGYKKGSQATALATNVQYSGGFIDYS